MVQSAEVIPINIEDEMRGSYLDYAMSVIIGRAIPDVRDGFKPVHRRILYAMYREGILSNKRFTKCAGVVGEVLKKYHPHGDAAVYDTLVRLAQDWNMRYPLIEGQGNFGSIDGDSAAAYRYTECRLTKLAEEMLADIDKETVDFQPNFDASTEEPIVLPSKVPNLILNGSDGIAVGMATKIPPHNLTEIVTALLTLIDRPDISTKELMRHVPGPDFPTGAFIYGTEGIRDAYESGKGVIRMRARAVVEPIAKGDREQIIVTEIPFQVNKARLIERIAELVQEGKIEGVADIRDESDRDGMRIVIELKRSTVAGVILNQLYKHTAMESSFGVIMLMIVNQQPKVLSLRDLLQQFIDHRREVVVRRTAFELRQAEHRAHILEGLKIAVENIDAVIALIKKAKSPDEARLELMRQFALSEVQAQAILEMRLQRLTGLERQKILDEYAEVLGLIKRLKAILADERLVFQIIREELRALRTNFGDERRTEIVARSEELSVEDLIQEEDMVVTVSHGGAIKRNPISIYRAQRRGGQGKRGMTTGEEDFVESLFVASTHHYLLVFSSAGRLYWLKVHEVPQIGRTAKGKSITNLIQMPATEHVAAILPIREFTDDAYVFMATAAGVVKKTALTEFSRPRAGGIIALTIEEGDQLIAAQVTTGTQDMLLSTQSGQAIRFPESDVRPMGRTAMGVIGIRLAKNDRVVSMETLQEKAMVLTVTANGFGKRTALDEYRTQSRGGSGTITIKTNDRNGPVVAVYQVNDTDDIMLVSNKGKIIRTDVQNISVQGRNTQGVRIFTLTSGEKVASVAKLAEKEE
ncbi:MAG: DNA gyrase subunit A [Deltaproteobacteria bacterium]|nr:DNA gyrase subunit A [Deltaproteobacteria bacterium]